MALQVVHLDRVALKRLVSKRIRVLPGNSDTDTNNLVYSDEASCGTPAAVRLVRIDHGSDLSSA